MHRGGDLRVWSDFSKLTEYPEFAIGKFTALVSASTFAGHSHAANEDKIEDLPPIEFKLNPVLLKQLHGRGDPKTEPGRLANRRITSDKRTSHEHIKAQPG